MIESTVGEFAGIGDVVCLIDKDTQLPISSEFVVLGIAHRPDPNNLMRKYLYLSDGNGAYLSDEVRVVGKLLQTQENSNEYEA